MARKNSDQEKPPTLEYEGNEENAVRSSCSPVPRGVASKDAGVACSQDAKRKLWAIHSFAWGMEQGTGLAPPRSRMHGWMHRLCALPPSLR
jgi:hypothetical protein